ncbi:MAG: cardiolipin synthase [Lachnospiraceae bacterium]|nr:cardiolipin synthase [Lachnospiraceae bacterium]
MKIFHSINKLLKKILKKALHRVVIVGLLLLLQIACMVVYLTELADYSLVIQTSLNVLSLLAVLAIVNARDNPSYKLAWVISILAFPLLGGTMYLLFSGWLPSKALRKKLSSTEGQLRPFLKQNAVVMESLERLDMTAAGQARYIRDYAMFPVWNDSTATYFRSGEENFPVLLDELKKAEHFIFLEYFIVEEGEMWDSILEILKDKAASGVDVRMIYDDLGSSFVLPYKYYRMLEQQGIKCEAFNKFIPVFSLLMNNRDHRKILVVDGHTAFTGGINLADEYINKKNKFGYWKDTGIMVRGEAAVNLTAMFLTLWNTIRPTDTDYSKLLPHAYHSGIFRGDGYIQPYGDSPLDNETVGENVYLNMISSAKKYLYIFTPYLIIDNEMMTALCLAAKRGVDIRIVTPEKPDKKMVFWLTQSYYAQLIDCGVKVYQYLPGFIHAKVFVCDDIYATVGTINLDYRSLYLHFECGVFLCYCSEIERIKEDAIETMEQSKLITREMARRKLPIRLAQVVLRVFAPLL